ncbi:glycosyltransferase family 2 protein [Christiangramia salexigens]|uniref:Glycosyl transferase family 2 n=1 Tax=Christiangramia salexigens TaxID=1913577 RepID=A0A1L3J4P2_9FLAO|nr:glycosyltransferase [Christiangramia salexigens]APG60095.1 glycosyl transferase family 2 [Christiangramia salexigens]
MNKKKKLTFSLIICTYQRADSLKRLLDSVSSQNLYPDEIIIVDGSENLATENMVSKLSFEGLEYFRVDEDNRGLTRQRNYGIKKSGHTDIICFLDDDIVLETNYFENLISTYYKFPDAMAVGGWIKDETEWKKISAEYKPAFDKYAFDNFTRKLGHRNVLRKKLGLLSHEPPGFMPEFSHGFSTGFLPPSGKTYEVEYFMGGVSSYRRKLFDKIKFSKYFEGYGLYEDMDFCLRASRLGKMYVNTRARVEHLHEESGRPDFYKYGKMVVRNGYYVWKIKNPNPNLRCILKWNAITFLLILVRIGNIYNTNEKNVALKDAIGRTMGWLSLIFNKPGKI